MNYEIVQNVCGSWNWYVFRQGELIACGTEFNQGAAMNRATGYIHCETIQDEVNNIMTIVHH